MDKAQACPTSTRKLKFSVNQGFILSVSSKGHFEQIELLPLLKGPYTGEPKALWADRTWGPGQRQLSLLSRSCDHNKLNNWRNWMKLTSQACLRTYLYFELTACRKALISDWSINSFIMAVYEKF